MEINLLMVLIFDIVVVAIIKAYFQRAHPSYSDTHPLKIGNKLTGSHKTDFLVSEFLLQTIMYFRSPVDILQELR